MAEGVEREGEAVLLCEAGCDELQGYLFGKSMPAEALLSLWIGARLPAAEAA